MSSYASASLTSSTSTLPRWSFPTRTSASDAAAKHQSTVGMITGLAVTGVLLLAVSVIGLLFWRKNRAARRGLENRGTRARSSSSLPITAEALASGSSSLRGASSGTTPTAGGAAASTTTTAPRTERVITRGGRRWGRNGSQRSTRTLPLYSEDPGEEDAVLIRKRESMHSQRLEEEGEGVYDSDEGSFSDDGGDDAERTPEGTPSIHLQPAPSQRRRAGSDAGAAAGARGWAEIPSYDEATGPRGAEGEPRVSDVTIPSGVEELRAGTAGEARVPRPRSSFLGPLLSRFGRGDRQDAAGDTLAMASYASAPATESGQATPTGPPMASRSAGQSLTSLLLHPTQTHDSTTSRTPPAGRTSRSSSGSFLRPTSLFHDHAGMPNDSSLSLALPISAPVPGSVIRSGTIAPKKGFTAEQIKFLSSTENINKIGMPVEDLERSTTRESTAGPSGRRRRSTNAGLHIRTGSSADAERPPPTWTDVVEDDRRRSSSSMVRSTSAQRLPDSAPTPGLPASSADESALETENEATMVEVPINTPAEAVTARPWTAPLQAAQPALDIEVVPPTPITRT